MRVVCLHRDKLDQLRNLGVPAEDLTPDGLGGTPYHLLLLSAQQLEALNAFAVELEDITPKAVRDANTQSQTAYLFCRGGSIPSPLRLRATYKGQHFDAEVRDGKIWFKHKSYDSPSELAAAICDHPVNGWKFLQYLDEKTGTWHELDHVRHQPN